MPNIGEAFRAQELCRNICRRIANESPGRDTNGGRLRRCRLGKEIVAAKSRRLLTQLRLLPLILQERRMAVCSKQLPRQLLLFAGCNGRYCGLAIVAEIGDGISDASHFLDRPRSEPHCFSTSARHVFPAAASAANLALHTSERSVTCSLRQVAMRRFPGSTLAQAFLISSAQAPNCAIAVDTSRNDKTAQSDKIFSI